MTEVFAHRGSSHLARENTVEAFVAARKLGADGVELDVHLTGDGIVVVHHDGQVPGLGPFVRLRSAELPAWLPSLAQALEACRPLAVNVEIKEDETDAGPERDRELAVEVARLLAERDDASSILVSSFSLAAIDAVRALRPNLATALLVDLDTDPMEALVTAREHGHGGLHPFFACVNAGLMTAAKDCGVAIRTWTVDDPARIAALAGLGVDAVITNDVAAALRALGRFHPAAEAPPPVGA
ncbi:MAG: glycerophosphodiester phosphodiesterase [Acidimicrobiales bacterium]